MAEIEQIMRIRHGLRLDQAKRLDIITQDAALKMYDQITGAVFIGPGRHLVHRPDGRRHRVMAIMMISVTERTREIGVRKALGARRREILWQFLLEAVFLTSVGGVLGHHPGASIGLGVHYATGSRCRCPVELRDRLRLLGSVGVVFFGLVPAIRAARLDPMKRCGTNRVRVSGSGLGARRVRANTLVSGFQRGLGASTDPWPGSADRVVAVRPSPRGSRAPCSLVSHLPLPLSLAPSPRPYP